MFREYPRRVILGATLMCTQSLDNAILSQATVLTQFYGVAANKVPIYGRAFSIGNPLGPLLLGPLFAGAGRQKMISGTYPLSGAMLTISARLFGANILDATTQTIVWVVIFFPTAGAGSADLTVS